jgi:hypothetical protein
LTEQRAKETAVTIAIGNVRYLKDLENAREVYDRLMNSRKVRRGIKNRRLVVEEIPINTEGELPLGILLEAEHLWGYAYWWGLKGLYEKHSSTGSRAEHVELEKVFAADLPWVTARLRDLF